MTPPATPQTPEAEAAILGLAMRRPHYFVTESWNIAAWVAADAEYERRWMTLWADRLPADTFESFQRPQPTTVPVLVDDPQNALGFRGRTISPVWAWSLSAGGYWPLVWLAGLPFVLRRRAVSPRRRGDTEVGTEVTL